ncbi:MAG: phosphoenolpyruvate--protein phosphotransferase [Candidatus Edwardsbacteria bacterium RIFOXYD12_FULL_50_11]|jgi:phosphotransferase system enzyme I (PtsI)|uniref:Phosphoenolpyruvate-protein phosphotransferase n=1 Tax=Candidatus Edwardsbacteria bacterium GWF2_54_11 TaxID=1817851 RepID=A0A1F5RDU7_9BACT|nr:MAG: phosphoenolpyruvate--protein phosphotransferase [Candidatus Edwardsbacteria bacterium RifOxyC12_full_54_24]OGF06076.1 MAG: phosphoenolpyruvate--protein phosphotransferase [Candidatus Edwardsbacteria bacterium RifOxyA12_full_54_48]OGF11883.1 MAG: phosphoenolpyruvate--protein phosphotransferase [Candidatus Edwardsbacteria bacterium GWE2_54_12]OGF12660.1 MAG: phosphoenolpyruvate--protein phosphotransferase [Candidatus Edwardsbacteria bacterium GWF2_54_11]OGF17117.1 MAG: phosphoenolpyruvate
MANETRLYGIPVSPGFGIGQAFIYRKNLPVLKRRMVDNANKEIARFHNALSNARLEIAELRDMIAGRLGRDEAELWTAQLMMLEDVTVIQATADRIREKKQDAASAFQETISQVAETIESSSNQYLKERVADIRDISWRVIKHIQSGNPSVLHKLSRNSVVVSHDLSAADTALMSARNIAGFITEVGGKTSHTAIVARSLEIPAVVGIKDALQQPLPGAMVIVDGTRGVVILDPLPQTLESYQQEQKEYQKHISDLKRLRKSKPVTLDGRRIELSANIELPEEIPSVKSHGAKGIGLFRTEYLFLTSSQLPDEEQQFAIYKQVAEKIAPDPVIIRTFDLGGDKINGHGFSPEANPFLGWRAIRFCLDRPEIFRAQLRAILRASAFGSVRIMLPMICCLEEVTQTKVILDSIRLELDEKKIAYDRNCQLGVMIETPAAALTSDILAPEVDFFSIGSNDLTQYTLAVDRVNEKVAKLYDPFNPAVLKLIKQVIESGHRSGIWVGLCGEMCADPLAVPLLLGLGLDEFSMNAVSVPEVKRMILKLRLEDCQKVAGRAMEAKSALQARTVLSEFVLNIFPDLALSCALERS